VSDCFAVAQRSACSIVYIDTRPVVREATATGGVSANDSATQSAAGLGRAHASRNGDDTPGKGPSNVFYYNPAADAKSRRTQGEVCL